MKTITYITATVIIAALMLNTANAQLALNISYQNNLKDSQHKDVVTIENNSPVFNNIKMNAVRDFLKRYPAVNNAKWYIADDGGFIAKFNANAVQNTVAYNRAGNWVHTIRRYDEKDMPQNVRATVKRIYFDYSIMHIEEIEDAKNSDAVFVVYVRDASTIKILRVCNEEMEVLHNYKRGDK